jgi:hypothetical protein
MRVKPVLQIAWIEIALQKNPIPAAAASGMG